MSTANSDTFSSFNAVTARAYTAAMKYCPLMGRDVKESCSPLGTVFYVMQYIDFYDLVAHFRGKRIVFLMLFILFVIGGLSAVVFCSLRTFVAVFDGAVGRSLRYGFKMPLLPFHGRSVLPFKWKNPYFSLYFVFVCVTCSSCAAALFGFPFVLLDVRKTPRQREI